MITMQEAAASMPVDWAINTLVSGILIDNHADPDFVSTPADIEQFEAAAPDLALALVTAAARQLPAQLPTHLNDDAIQEMDQTVRAVTRQAFDSLQAESKANIVALVSDMIENS